MVMVMRRPLNKTTGRAKGALMNAARSRLRMDKLRHLSAEGVSREEAAEAVGMTLKGVAGLLRKHEGTEHWPIR